MQEKGFRLEVFPALPCLVYPTGTHIVVLHKLQMFKTAMRERAQNWLHEVQKKSL